MLVKIGILSFIVAVSTGCGEKKSDDKNAEESTPDEGEGDDSEDDEVGTAGSLAIDMPVTDAMNITDQAIQTAITGEVATSMAGQLEVGPSFRLLAEDSVASEFNPNCAPTTSAFDTVANKKMEPSNPLWPGREIYCKLNGPASSPESVRGAFLIAKGIICAGAKIQELKFEKEEDSFSGNVTISTECFGDFAKHATDLEEGQVMEGIQFKSRLLENDPNGWQKQISYKTPDDDNYEVINYMISEESLSFASRDWAVTVNAKDGRLSYEMLDDEHDRHVRLMAAGKLDVKTGELSEVSQVEAIYSGESRIGSIKGTKEEGYFSNSYAYSGEQSDYADLSFSDFVSVATRCSQESCADKGLEFDKEEYFSQFVYFVPQMEDDGLRGMKPVDFSSVGWD